MKKILLIALIAFTLPSCNNLLEEESISNVTDSYLNTVSGFEAAVRGLIPSS